MLSYSYCLQKVVKELNQRAFKNNKFISTISVMHVQENKRSLGAWEKNLSKILQEKSLNCVLQEKSLKSGSLSKIIPAPDSTATLNISKADAIEMETQEGKE